MWQQLHRWTRRSSIRSRRGRTKKDEVLFVWVQNCVLWAVCFAFIPLLSAFFLVVFFFFLAGGLVQHRLSCCRLFCTWFFVVFFFFFLESMSGTSLFECFSPRSTVSVRWCLCGDCVQTERSWNPAPNPQKPPPPSPQRPFAECVLCDRESSHFRFYWANNEFLNKNKSNDKSAKKYIKKKTRNKQENRNKTKQWKCGGRGFLATSRFRRNLYICMYIYVHSCWAAKSKIIAGGCSEKGFILGVLKTAKITMLNSKC